MIDVSFDLHSRIRQPFRNRPQNFCISLVRIVETWSVHDDYPVIHERVAESRNRFYITKAKFAGTGTQLVADFHARFFKERIYELKMTS